MSFSQSALVEVIDSIYEASLDTSRFPSMLKHVAEFVGGISADYYIHRGNRVLFGSFFGIAEELFVDYLSNYHANNPRLSVY